MLPLGAGWAARYSLLFGLSEQPKQRHWVSLLYALINGQLVLRSPACLSHLSAQQLWDLDGSSGFLPAARLL